MRTGEPAEFLVMEPVNRAPDRGCHRRLTPRILVLPDPDVAAAQVVEARGQIGAIGRSSGGAILEHALAAGGVQDVELPVEDRRPSAVETRA